MGALFQSDGDRVTGATVGDVVYGRLRADILSGDLAPGARLRLDVASRTYGVSVGTMRELLSRLASEGLVVAEGQRGFQVAPASASEFKEVADLRILLEGHATMLSFAAGDLDWEARVVAAHHKLAVLESRTMNARSSGGGEDLSALRQADREFHRALISACGSRVLMETYASVHDRYLRYLSIAVIFRGEISVREHAELLNCALTRDTQGARQILDRHIGSCVDYALAHTPLEWTSRPPGHEQRRTRSLDQRRARPARGHQRRS